MSHSYNNVWIHAIWGTKFRQPLILPEIENKVYAFMQDQFIQLNCPVKAINGIQDHVHCLFVLDLKRSVAETIKQVKGSTAYYVNQQNLVPGKFAWQTGYAAYSVSISGLKKVEKYIRNQKHHHLIEKTFHL
jgi:REP element-mobilizing transposase RayT